MKLPPTTFALVQRCVTFAPLFFYALLVSGAMWLIQRASGSWMGTLLLFVTAGGGAIGYGAWLMECEWNGLIRTPRHPWRVALQDSNILVRTHRLTTTIPVDCVVSAEIVVDGSWDQMKGIEQQCLVLHFASSPIISIPGSTKSFDKIVAGLREIVRIRFRELGADP